MGVTQSSFQIKDLAGCRVETEKGEYLGSVEDIYQTGSNDIFVVRRDGLEYLIPALSQVIQFIDLGRKRITVTLPDGLRQIYERTGAG